MEQTQTANDGLRVVIGLGSCGIAAGAQDVKDAIAGALSTHGVRASLEHTGCNGACHREPIVEVYQGDTHWTYGSVTVAQAEEIVASLRRRNVPHEYHLYEGEGHGWRKPETIEKFYQAVEAFLKQHVLFA